MSQVVSIRDDPKRFEGFEKKMQKIFSDQSQISQLYEEHVFPSRELIFLQSQSNFIEKTLGQGEKMKIRFECLVAHAYTVKVSRAPPNDFEFN